MPFREELARCITCKVRSNLPALEGDTYGRDAHHLVSDRRVHCWLSGACHHAWRRPNGVPGHLSPGYRRLLRGWLSLPYNLEAARGGVGASSRLHPFRRGAVLLLVVWHHLQ